MESDTTQKPILFFEKSPMYPKIEGLFHGEQAEILVWEYFLELTQEDPRTIPAKQKLLKLFNTEVKPLNPEIPTHRDGLEDYIEELNDLKKKTARQYDNLLCKEVKKIINRTTEYTKLFSGEHDSITQEYVNLVKDNYRGKATLISCSCASEKEREILRASKLNFSIWPCWTRGRRYDKAFAPENYEEMIQSRIDQEKAILITK